MTVLELMGFIDAIRAEGYQTWYFNHIYLTERDWAEVTTELTDCSSSVGSHSDSRLGDVVGYFYGCPVRIALAASFQCDTGRIPLDPARRKRWAAGESAR